MTSAAAMTFDQMERRADRTFALALWAKHASQVVQGVMLMTLVSWATRNLVQSLSPERLESLYQEHAIDLIKRLQELHDLLVILSSSREVAHLSQSRIFRAPIKSLQESTEDLGDIIEDLLLSENEQFRQLVANCAQSLSQPKTAAGTLGRM